MMVHWSRAELDSAEKVMMMIGPFLLLGLLLPYGTRNAQKNNLMGSGLAKTEMRRVEVMLCSLCV